MAIHSAKNLYPGINPHLNSALQQRGGDWKSFHAYHIIHLAEHLNDTLPPGYLAKPEKSLQISVYDPLSFWPDEEIRTRIPDVLITRKLTSQESAASVLEPDTPTLVLPIASLVDEEDELMAVVIYHDRKPVTHIELLSPANKPDGGHFNDYWRNRFEVFNAGLRLVEIDYLHERHPISEDIPSYKARQPNSFPYHILVTDPRPSVSSGLTKVYSKSVMDRLPSLDIPLEDKDTVKLDFNEVYNHTFSQRPFVEEVDYAQEPINFAAYSDADQQAIREHMAQIAVEHR
jgi:hypothetical protein